MIQACIFDFGQTLVNSAEGFRKAETQAQRKVFGTLGDSVSWDEFIARYRLERKRYKDYSNLSKRLLWQDVIRQFGGRLDEALLVHWETKYWETVTAYTVLYPEAEEVLRELHARFRLAMITNTQGQADSGPHRIMHFTPLVEYFEAIIIAGEKDIPPKPDLKAFQACLNRLKLNPDEVVFIGDDWHMDIQGALHAGIAPVWIKHHLVKRSWPDAADSAVPVITSLKELLDLDALKVYA